jgi:predicted transcriptional regulator
LSPESSESPTADVITDDLVAQVSARVLEQLTDRVVRETVAEIAERLVREEIERIKASIQ